jgi:hypothetical protein
VFVATVGSWSFKRGVGGVLLERGTGKACSYKWGVEAGGELELGDWHGWPRLVMTLNGWCDLESLTECELCCLTTSRS